MARGNYQSIYTGQQIDQRLTDVSNKVDKVAGKGLSANDYTNEDKAAVQSVASKADKVVGAVANNLAGLDANGNLADSGSKASDFEAAGAAATAVSGHNTSAAAHGGVEGKVSAIEGKIPSQASSVNKLADKEFVNSSIATATATFRGTFDCTEEYVAINKNVDELNTIQLTAVQKFFFWGDFPEGKLDKIDFTYDEEYEEYIYSAKDGRGNVIKSGVLRTGDYDNFTSGDIDFRIKNVESETETLFVKSSQIVEGAAANAFDFVSLGFGTPDANDYCYILRVVVSNRQYDRYKFASGEYEGENPWQYEYTLNNSSFTAAQWAAINSGISAGLIPSGTTSTNKLTNAADVAAAIAAGAEVFMAIYGSTTYADILAAYNAGKLVVCKNGSMNGLICYIDNASTPKAIYFSSQTDYFYMWKVNENDEWSSITREWENVSRKVTTLSAGSTDAQYPSAKCVYDATKDKADKTTEEPLTYASGQTYTLTANKIATLNASTAASGDSISIALPASPAVTDEFDIRITTGGNALGITMPTGVTWSGGTTPTSLDANATYEINISGGLGLCVKF